jgi:hypothetical protein
MWKKLHFKNIGIIFEANEAGSMMTLLFLFARFLILLGEIKGNCKSDME